MNTYQNIQELLEKYWEGETTLEEERLLKQYFISENIDERLQAYAPLFHAIREEQTVQFEKVKLAPMRPTVYGWSGWAVAASVVLLIAAGIWWFSPKPALVEWVKAEPKAKELNKIEDKLEQEKIEEQSTAAETQAVVIKTPKHRKKSVQLPKKSKEIDPEAELAMQEIKAALALLSSKIKKGKSEAAKGASHLEEMDRVFKKKEG